MAPFADAARIMIGPYSGVVALLAFIKACGTLCGWVLLTAQTGKSAADRKLFPAFLARVDRSGTPVANLCFMAALMSIVIVLTTSGTLAEQFSRLIEMSVLLCVATYVFACVAVWRYPVPGAAVTAARERIIASAAILFCVYLIAESGLQVLTLFAAFGVCTSLLYLIALRTKRASESNQNSISPSR
jgi:amino acid transporter